MIFRTFFLCFTIYSVFSCALSHITHHYFPSLKSAWWASRPKPSPWLPSLIEESFLSSNPLGTSYISCPEEHCRAHTWSSPHPLIIPRLHHLVKCIGLVISIVVAATHGTLQTVYPKDWQPYHTSALSGQEWVIELLTDHPECIHCELGMHAPAFVELITQLCTMGHSDSKFISLEKQLAIFLYTSVTGLSVRHVRERFQHSNETISKYIKFISKMQWISDSSA
jgi:hypothetical protein